MFTVLRLGVSGPAILLSYFIASRVYSIFEAFLNGGSISCRFIVFKFLAYMTLEGH